MADKKNLCAQIDTALHMRVRQEQERSGRTLSEFVEQLITDYYKMKEGTKMTGDMRTMAIQLPEELFERLKAYLKKNNLKQKQFIIGLIEDALETARMVKGCDRFYLQQYRPRNDQDPLAHAPADVLRTGEAIAREIGNCTVRGLGPEQ